MFYAIIISISLGLFSIFPPYLGFFYTAKIIKEFEERGLIKGLIILGISSAIISYIFGIKPLVLVFFSIYGTIIILYFILKKIDFMSEWDKAFVIAIVAIIGIYSIYITNTDFFISFKDALMKQISLTITKIDGTIDLKEIQKVYIEFFKGTLALLFTFTFVSYLLTRYFVNKDGSDKWEFSYVFILGFIIAFIAIKFYNVKNIIVLNIVDAVKNVYAIYGIKCIYVFVKEKTKGKGNMLGVATAMLLYSIHPIILFILGSITSFKLFRTKQED